MTTPYPQNPFPNDHKLSSAQAAAYLARIRLPPSLLFAPASLELLSRLYTAQNEQVPKDTSSLHVSPADWAGPSRPIVLGSHLGRRAGGMADQPGDRFRQVVELGRGGYCWVNNTLLAEFLRVFGFRVSVCAARVYLGRGEGRDPETHEDGWHWGTYTHIVLIVDWENSDGRYLVDAGWGPCGQSVPIKLENEVPTEGHSPYEAFQLKNEELPLSPWMPKPIDSLAGWTLYRRVAPAGEPVFPITPSPTAHWTPHLHFHLISIPVLDIQLYNHFSASHALAFFTAHWLVTRILPGTGGARRSMMFRERPGQPGRRLAKVMTTGGREAKGAGEGRDVEWVEMETGPMKEALAREFGFKFEWSDIEHATL